jgi:flagellar basal-body rod protein FlgB
MPISELPILSMLRTKMQWHQERQRLLAENVANADTPSFTARDLAPLKLDGNDGPQAPVTQVSLARTDPHHIVASSFGSAPGFAVDRKVASEVRPTGNAVNLEDEMMKVAANQIDYQAAASLYSRSLGLIKTALGKA